MKTRLERLIEKYEQRQAKAETKRKAKRLHDEAWAKVSAQVSMRDKGLCRVCTCQTVRFGKGDPRLWGMAHHVVYRSAGGPDTPENCIWVCQSCHDKEHRHRIRISGTAEALEIAHGTDSVSERLA